MADTDNNSWAYCVVRQNNKREAANREKDCNR